MDGDELVTRVQRGNEVLCSLFGGNWPQFITACPQLLTWVDTLLEIQSLLETHDCPPEELL